MSELLVGEDERVGREASAEQARVTLDSLPPGAGGRVVAIGGGAVARRLMEMGVVPGAPVRVIKRAPLGDPIEVRVRNYHLAIRRTEAQTITVTNERPGEKKV